MAWIEEFLIVLAYSTKTQLAILLGVVFFFGMMALGHHYASNLNFSGMLAPLADLIRSLIEQKYEKAAWGGLFGFLMLAVKCYRKDWKRLWHQ